VRRSELVGQCDEHAGESKVLVGAKVTDRLDPEILVQQFGVGVGDAGQRRRRRVEDLFEALVLVGLVQAPGQINRNGYDLLLVSARPRWGGPLAAFLADEAGQADVLSRGPGQMISASGRTA